MSNSVLTHTNAQALRLLEIAEKIELASHEAGDDGVALIRAANLSGAVELVLLPLLPFDLLPTLSEMITGSHWEATGVLTTGFAKRFLEDRETERVGIAHSVVLCDRSGTFASVLRVAGEAPISRLEHGLESPAGRVIDALRRTMRLPTAPPGLSPARLVAHLWIQRVLVEAMNLSANKHLNRAAINQLRPSGWSSWQEVRNQCLSGQLGELGLSPSLAAWMDVGILSRWAFSNLPELHELLVDLEELLTESDMTYFRDQLLPLLEQ